MAFQWEEEARREQILLRAALVGANGSGKSLGALKIAAGFAGEDGKIAVVDTEKGRAKLYADQFRFAHLPIRAEDATPELMLAAAREAADRVGVNGVVVMDTISHEWLEVLTEVDKFGDWKDVTPRHREFVEGITAIPAHLVVTMRAKVKYEITEVEVQGRNKPRQVINRLGVGPVQREGVEYEFDILAYLDSDHLADFANRCEKLVEGPPREIDDEAIAIMKEWVETGDARQPQRIVTLKDVPVPRSWAAIKEAAEAYSAETWADFREFLGQAREHLYPGVEEAALTKAQKDTLFQYSAAVMTNLLETHAPDEFPPPIRIEFQAHWAKALGGQVLEGPPWSMDPEEAAAGRPSRTDPSQPPPKPEGSGGEEAELPAAAEPATDADPAATDQAAPSPLEQTVTDAPLTDNEQEVLAAIKEEFPGATEVPEPATEA
jgi:AAA domain-containing protein